MDNGMEYRWSASASDSSLPLHRFSLPLTGQVLSLSLSRVLLPGFFFSSFLPSSSVPVVCTKQNIDLPCLCRHRRPTSGSPQRQRRACTSYLQLSLPSPCRAPSTGASLTWRSSLIDALVCCLEAQSSAANGERGGGRGLRTRKKGRRGWSMGICFGSARSGPIPPNDGSSSPGAFTSRTSSATTTTTTTTTTATTTTFGSDRMFSTSIGSVKQLSDTSEGTDGGNRQKGMNLAAPNLRIFTFAELKSATKNFKPETLLGEGGFGRVFKGWVDEKTLNPAKCGSGMVVAVKKLNPESMQGLAEWQSEVNFLGSLSHPNLVRLIGYCWEDKDLLLVYEFMMKGSLENHLFKRGATPLNWEVRLRILIGAARGLAFLHSSDRKVIYRDFKASNILLDSNYNAKISDFGLAKNGPIGADSHVTTRVMGTYGYAAPEYVATGHLYVKSDVYGFGVVLLEMLSGLRALDTNRPSGQHNLIEWKKVLLGERRKLSQVMDPRLESYPLKAALQASRLALRCLASEPKGRPSMQEVAEALEQIQAMGGARGAARGAASPRLPPGRTTHSPRHGRGGIGVRPSNLLSPRAR